MTDEDDEDLTIEIDVPEDEPERYYKQIAEDSKHLAEVARNDPRLSPAIDAMVTRARETNAASEVMGRIRPRGFSVERILVIPDSHFPFVSQEAWATVMKAGRAFRPDRIIHLGDLWDFYAISFHPKSPDRKTNLEAEIKSGCDALDEMATGGFWKMPRGEE